MISARPRRSEPANDTNLADTDRALRCLHLLMRSVRLYERHHPHTLQSLDNAYDALRAVATKLNGLEIRVDRGGALCQLFKLGNLCRLACVDSEVNNLV